ncbi:hypothetical protein, partial [Rhizobium halophytocola]|uniref:hypothetical protein n=1 Tax=Rhizobium halophytocola TaxID=735519 RepID=UPI0036062EEC
VAGSPKAVLRSDPTTSVGTIVADAAAHTATWTGDIPAGDQLILTLSLTVSDPIPQGVTQITNLCVVDSVEVCRVDTPTAAQVTPAKSLTKETGGTLADIAEPGETLDYQVTLTNDGGATAQNYVFVDQYDANTTLVAGSPKAVLRSDPTTSVGTIVADAAAHTATWTGDIPAGDQLI